MIRIPSDALRLFLERDAEVVGAAKGQFQIYYKLGSEQPEYIPDFVAELDSAIFMVGNQSSG